jgi:hypothetical protein
MSKLTIKTEEKGKKSHPLLNYNIMNLKEVQAEIIANGSVQIIQP